MGEMKLSNRNKLGLNFVQKTEDRVAEEEESRPSALPGSSLREGRVRGDA